MKTGTSDSGYSLALTNKQHRLRLNETILDVSPYPSETAKLTRNEIANDMMNIIVNNTSIKGFIQRRAQD